MFDFLQEFKPDKNSWHYKFMMLQIMNKDMNIADDGLFKKDVPLISEYVDDPNSQNMIKFFRPKDFCSYWRTVVIWPAFCTFLNMSLLITGLFFISQWTILGLLTVIAFLALSAICLIGIFTIMLWLKGQSDLARNNSSDSNPSLIATKVMSVKSKICPMVEYSEDV